MMFVIVSLLYCSKPVNSTVFEKISIPLGLRLVGAVYTTLSSLSKRNWTTSSRPTRHANSLLHDGMRLKSLLGSCCQTRKRHIQTWSCRFTSNMFSPIEEYNLHITTMAMEEDTLSGWTTKHQVLNAILNICK